MINTIDCYNRSRINLLMQKAVLCPVVMLTAGRGYGKTQILESYLRQTSHRKIWLSLSQLDQEIDHFWDNFLFAVKPYSPALYDEIKEFDFPKSMVRFNSFIRLFTNELYMGEKLVFIVDNYDAANNFLIDQFFRQIIELELENLCLILVTSEKTSLALSAIEKGSLFTIGTEELAFQRTEIENCFESFGKSLTSAQIAEIQHLTDGWPIALAVLMNGQDYSPAGLAKQLAVLDNLFEESISAYPLEIQQLFIQLAVVDSFTMDIIRMLGTFEPVTLYNTLRKNPFVYYDRNEKSYCFSRLFREFLLRKDTNFNSSSRYTLLLHTGEVYLKIGNLAQAVRSFMSCGEFDRVLEIINAHRHGRYGDSRFHNNALYLSAIEKIQEDEVENKLLLRFLKASFRFEMGHLDAAQVQLLELAEELPAGNLLCEVYCYLGNIALSTFDDSFLDYFKKSLDAAPNYREKYYMGNALLFTLPSYEPNAVTHAKELMADSAFYWQAHFGNSSMVNLFIAEADYYTYQHDSARIYASKAAQKAFHADQHDVLCNAHRILALISLYEGDYDGFTTHTDFIINYIVDLNLRDFEDIMECARGIKRLVNKNLDKIFLEELTNVFVATNHSPAAGWGNRVILADYLLHLQQYEALLSFLDETEREFTSQRKIINLIDVHALRAMAHFRLGDMPDAIESFRKAYDMSYHNNVLIPFTDRTEHMLAFLRTLPPDHDFDPVWIKNLQNTISALIKRMAKMYQTNAARSTAPAVNLSKREREILRDLSTGLTREEIATMRFIAVSTVKTIITSIYSKLGAVNRADAIRIASKLNLI